MIKDVIVVDASAHSYNLRKDNYAAGRYSQAVVDAFHGAHHGGPVALSQIDVDLGGERYDVGAIAMGTEDRLARSRCPRLSAGHRETNGGPSRVMVFRYRTKPVVPVILRFWGPMPPAERRRLPKTPIRKETGHA
jgi:hypothetical protein